jgi:hypothetical protein
MRAMKSARARLGALARAVVCEALECRRLLSRFAVIGDFTSGSPLRDVSNQIKSWNPDYIVTVGDNYYFDSSIDTSVGQYFHDYISPYNGSYGSGSSSGNRFWPTLGNHDYDRGLSNYTNYFSLPGNERYYTFTQGNVQNFIINSNTQESDGTSSSSKQAQWLQNALAASTATWKLVYFHHPAYTSGNEGNNTYMRWPFQQWGASAVFSGHDHIYERILKSGFPYFVDGLGGAEIASAPTRTESGSQIIYRADYGAMLLDAGSSSLNLKFITRNGTVIDDYTINSSQQPPAQGTPFTSIPTGANWKYLDNGSNQGTAWRSLSFDDSSWKSGNAELGYGDGDEATVVSFGPNASNKYATTYFRKSFNIADKSSVTSLNLRIKRDDGAVVYLNGSEVYRTNMSGGTIAYNSFASSAIEDNTFYSASLSPSLLSNGNNVIAVEIHQSDGGSSDISFNFELTGTTTGTVTNPPSAPTNLNASAVSSSQIDLIWNDNSGSETSYIVDRALSSSGPWSQIASLAANSTSYSDTGLSASTTYYYRVRAANSGGESANTNTASATTQAAGSNTTVTYIPTGSTWKYLDNGSNQGTGWRATGFDDSSWKSGAAQLGYGDGDEATVVGYGGNGNNKYITTYFRKSFTVTDPSQVSGLSLRILRDDGAVVYVNGTEVYRTNMPTGTVSYTTRASAAIEDTSFYTANVSASLLQAGNNVIAVEIHQADPTSSDISFDLELKGTVTTATQPPPTSTTLPSPWNEGDIGTGGLAGSATFENNTFTVNGSGNDIWFNADGLHYVYQQLSGDGTIVARVGGVQNTNAWAKAGVMMRDSLAAGAKEASMTVSAASGTVFIFRTASDGASDGAFASGAAPLWVKLIRSGSLFTGYQSGDGTTWTQVGSQSISMGSTIYVGLAVTAKNNAALNTSTFSDVSISAAAASASTTFAANRVSTNTPTTEKKNDLLDVLV